MKSPSHIFVVDADIARAAGPDPKDRPWSEAAKDAHDLLIAIWQCSGYRVVFDQTLLNEWKEHQGKSAQAWLARMVSRRRVIKNAEPSKSWISALIVTWLPANEQDAAEKDSHLVALANDPGDQRLLSNDIKARKKFERIFDDRVQRIHWVAASQDCRQWLVHGAYDKPDWTVGGS